MSNDDLPDDWSYCPECGIVWEDGRRICEINGAGAHTLLIPPEVGLELQRADGLIADWEKAMTQARDRLAKVGVGDKPMAAKDGDDILAAYRLLNTALEPPA